MKLAVTYTILAILATATNIGIQDAVFRIYTGPLQIALSIAAGTAAGLIAKYILDKRYIFKFQTKSASHDGKTFILYTSTGIITTAIFIAFELGFEHAFNSPGMRYLGGTIGLGIGYTMKYQLDKRYVFRERTS